MELKFILGVAVFFAILFAVLIGLIVLIDYLIGREYVREMKRRKRVGEARHRFKPR